MTETTATALTYPTRSDAALRAVPGTLDYSTLGGRFYARKVFGTPITTEGYRITDQANPVERPEGEAFAENLPAARRHVADVVDREHRAAVIAYTVELAEQDPAVAEQVAAMRHSAAIHGRVTGSVGANWSENRGHLIGGEELTVYVAREEYAAVLGDDDRAELDTNDRHTTPASATRDDYVSELADAVVAVLGEDRLTELGLTRTDLGRAVLDNAPLLALLVPAFA